MFLDWLQNLEAVLGVKLMNITFRQLKVFVRIYELRSFTATASALHVTQSAVSKLCSELEGEVGFPLFERSTRKVVPMDGASDLYKFALELLGTLDAASRSLSDLTSVRKGNVGVAAAPMIFYSLLCDVTAEFQAEYPDISLEVYELSTDYAVDYVLNGKVDFGIAAVDQDDSRLIMEPIYQDSLRLACLPSHPLAKGEEVSWRQLASEKMIMLRPVTNLGRLVRSNMEGIGFVQVVEVGDLTSAIGLVQSGAGVAVVPEYISSFAKSCGVVMLPFQETDKCTRVFSLIRRRNARLSIAAEKFVEMMRIKLLV